MVGMRVEIKYIGRFSSVTSKGRETIEVSEDATLREVLEKLTVKYEASFREALLDSETGEVKPFNWVLINGKDARELLGMKTKINNGDRIALLHAVGGG